MKIIILAFIDKMLMDLSTGEKYKLRISSRKLSSGNYQVKFEMKESEESNSYYGYILVKPRTTLKDTIRSIEYQLDNFLNPYSFMSSHGPIVDSCDDNNTCMIFRSKDF